MSEEKAGNTTVVDPRLFILNLLKAQTKMLPYIKKEALFKFSKQNMV